MLSKPRFRTVQEREQYYRWQVRAGIFIAVVLFGMILFQLIHEKQLSSYEKELALDDYKKDYVQQQDIEARHEKCFEYNYRRRSKTCPESFNRSGYRNCLNMGPEKWILELRKKQAEESKRLKEIQDVLN